jgi:S-adenosylmethionine synthetase
MSFRRVAFLVNINSSVTGALEILDTLGTEVKVFNKEAAFPTIDELLKSSKELSADAKRLASNISNLNDEDVLGQSSALINRAEQIEKSMYRIANAHESFDKSEQDHLGRAEKIESTAKSFKKSQPGYISTFKNFLINHRGRLAGVFSLTALLVYYYKFVR